MLIAWPMIDSIMITGANRITRRCRRNAMTTNVRVLLFLVLWSLSLSAQSAPTPQEQQLIDELNQSRSEAGLPPLRVDPRLTRAAREHSQRMAKQRTLSHVLSGEPQVAERIAATGLTFNRSGENVGYNTDLSDVHSTWMKSPGHRKNILESRYNAVGIGLVRGSDGIYWATQDFAYVVEQRSASEAEDLIAKQFAELRRKAGAASLERVSQEKLHNVACAMGEAGRLNPKQVLSMPSVRYALTFSNSNVEELPSSAQQLASEKSLRKYGVGACFVKGSDNPGGTYYVVMAFY